MPNLPIGQPLVANGPFPLVITATFSNATRPPAASWSSGYIWNSDALALQYSDGTIWRNVSPGNIVTWTQSQPWSTILPQLQSLPAAILLLVDDGTGDTFVCDQASGDLSNVRWVGAAGFFASPSLTFSTGWSTTSSSMQFENINILAGSAPLLTLGVDDFCAIELYQSAILGGAPFGTSSGPVFVLADEAVEVLFLLLKDSQISLYTANNPIIIMGQNSAVDVSMINDGAILSAAGPFFVLGSGATSARVNVGADSSSALDFEAFGAGVTPIGTHAEQGVANFVSSGTGPGTNWVDVVFGAQFTTLQSIQFEALVVEMAVDGATIPVVGVSLVTVNGFRIRTNTPFNGSVRWSVVPFVN